MEFKFSVSLKMIVVALCLVTTTVFTSHLSLVAEAAAGKCMKPGAVKIVKKKRWTCSNGQWKVATSGAKKFLR